MIKSKPSATPEPQPQTTTESQPSAITETQSPATTESQPSTTPAAQPSAMTESQLFSTTAGSRLPYLSVMKDEKILGSWNYGKLKGKMRAHGCANLTVTNKRVINRSETEQGITRAEIPVSEIRTINGSYKAIRLLRFFAAALVFLMIGIIVLAIGIAGYMVENEMNAIILGGIFCLVVAVAFMVAFFLVKRKVFTLVITSPIHDEGMVVGRSSLASRQRKHVKTKGLKMVYDENVAKSLLNVIGMLVYSQHENK